MSELAFVEIVAVEIASRTVAGSSLRVSLVEEGGRRGVVLEEREAARLFPSFQRPMIAIDLDAVDEVLEAIGTVRRMDAIAERAPRIDHARQEERMRCMACLLIRDTVDITGLCVTCRALKDLGKERGDHGPKEG